MAAIFTRTWQRQISKRQTDGGAGDNFQEQADQQVTVMDTYQSCQYGYGSIPIDTF